jgi:hypothetical protein
MIYSRHSARTVSLLAFLPLMLTGLSAQERGVSLKNWATPLYWQPNQAEREEAAPQIAFSGNQVSTNALTFVAVTPCRLVDTRGSAVGFMGDSPFAGPSLTAGATATFPVQSTTETATSAPAACGAIPSIAQAYSFNVTVVPHGGGAVDYITIWPAGAAKPVVSTLDDVQGLVVANAAIVPAGTPSGGINVYNYGPATTDVIIDLNGFFAAPSDLLNNTAIGAEALFGNTTGSNNTASGFKALEDNTTGIQNTASGASALLFNTTGNNNTANGASALSFNSTGSNNTASGSGALLNNSTGGDNTAAGALAMQFNTAGGSDTAIGSQALRANTTGIFDTATGASALQSNTTGEANTASGVVAMYDNTTGGFNTAIGYTALESNTTGGYNIAIGAGAGVSAPAGNSNSIYIGSFGSASDASGTISLGAQGTQTGGTYIAGIYGATAASGAEVYVTSSGQLGTVLSSGRFKEQITDMGDRSSKLLQLRPVNFFYKPEYDDGSHLLQYGLIAEEVAKVYPEMVAYDRNGQVLTVKYQLLAPMLLNEVQKQAEQNRKLQDRLAALEELLSGAPEPVR